MLKKFSEYQKVNEAEVEYYDDFRDFYNALEGIESTISKAGYKIDFQELREEATFNNDGTPFEINLYEGGYPDEGGTKTGKKAEVSFEQSGRFNYVSVKVA